MRLLTAQDMRELDRATIEDVGIPGVVLMEIAGRSVADRVWKIARASGVQTAFIICGTGNNGGDGFVATRHLADRGMSCVVVILGRRDQIRGDAAINLGALLAFDVEVAECPDVIPHKYWDFAHSAVVVDAIFGTGLSREISGYTAEVIDRANALPGPKVAVDIPSGVEADTGHVLGTAFKADVTMTFGAANIGHFMHPGADLCGDVEVVPIGIPTFLTARTPGIDVIGPETVRANFPARPKDAFKNRFGHVLVVGGFQSMAGAALLCATAALRTGVGLADIATTRSAAMSIEGRQPEVMVHGAFSDSGELIQYDPDVIRDIGNGKTALVLGPGLSVAPGVSQIIRDFLDLPIATVFDADALNMISSGDVSLPIGWVGGPPRIITPHPGEASRLLGITTHEVQADRIGTARRLTEKTGAVVVLKGAGTLVAAPDGRMAIDLAGTPALATAGTGDVLAGCAGALLARGIDAFDAACSAVLIHSTAGRIAGNAVGEYSVIAGDVVMAIPDAIVEMTVGAGSLET